LHPDDLQQISKAYGDASSGRVVGEIRKYQANMRTGTTEEKLSAMSETRALLIDHITTAERAGKDSGFGMHVLKKFYFDAQQELQLLMGAQKPDNLDAAFASALKLDQAGIFFKTVSSAIRNNQVASPEFQAFLQECIDKGNQATNHSTAVQASKEVVAYAERTMATFDLQLPPVEHVDINLDEVDLDAVDPLDRREEVLAEQRHDLVGLAPTETLREHVGPFVAPPPEEVVAKAGLV
jgi:hypothetical protein